MDLNKPGELRNYVGDAREAVIPEGVKWICDEEFQGLKTLESVVFPSTLETIGRRAFRWCSVLESVNIPDSVTWIGDSAFASCTKLFSVNFGNGIEQIGKDAFAWCGSLAKVELPASVEQIGESAFHNCSNLSTVSILGPVKAIGRGTFLNCALRKIELPASVVYIGADAFYGCRDVNATLPDGCLRTGNQLDASLALCLPDDAETMAYVLAFQQGKTWANAVGKKAGTQASEVLDQAMGLLSGEKKVNAKVAANLVEFALNHSRRIQKERFLALRELISRGNKRKTKALAMLEEDPRVAAYFVSDDAEPAREVSGPSSPVEALVAAKMLWDDVSLKLRKKLKKGVKLAGLDVVSSPDVLNYIISAYARITPERVHITVEPGNPYVNIEGFGDYRKAYWIGACFCPEADEVAKALDKTALADALGELVAEGLWEDKKLVPEALTAYARYADEAHVATLVTYINKWVRGKGWLKKGAVIARGALMLNDTKAAMLYLDTFGALPAYARLRGMDPNVLRDTQLADFGFDGDGRKVYELGDKTVTVSLADDLTLRLVNDETGKTVRSIPKRGSDPELYEAARADLAAMRKNIKKAISGRRDKLFADFLSGKETKVEDWVASYLGNPVLRSIAQLLVWQQGERTFIVCGKETVDVAGQPVVLDGAGIALAHPMYMEPADVAAWQQYLLRNKLRQPFQQMWEPVVNLNAIEPDRYSYIKIRAYLLRNKERHGIHVVQVGYYDYDVRFDDCRAVVAYISSERHAVSQDDYCAVRNIAILKHSRKSNHIIGYLDRCALYAGAYMCIDDDDVAALEPLLEQLDLAKTIDLLGLASERGAVKVAARLLDYKEEKFPEAAGVDSLEL